MSDQLDWYEATGADVTTWKVDLDDGTWTFRQSSREKNTARSGRMSEAQLTFLRDAANQIGPEHDLGGPDLSAAGTQQFVVVVADRRTTCRAGAAESLPGKAGEVVDAVLKLVLA